VTQVLRVHPDEPDPGAIARAARVLREGGTVAFPTETVYGLGANALDAHAVRRIFAAKGRPAEDPLIVHLATADDLGRVARAVPAVARPLVEAFWPGPLTLVLPRAPEVPGEVTAGLGTVAVRVPSHPVALALLRAARVPVAAPSANRYGRASPTCAQHVLDDLEGRVDLVLDGGPTTIGVESTVLDLTREPPRILRPGGVPREAIEAIVGPVEMPTLVHAGTVGAPSPGLAARHYAVMPELVVVESASPHATPEVLAAVRGAALDATRAGRRVGLLLAEEDLAALGPDGAPGGLARAVRPLGRAEDLTTVARELFSAMRELERAGVEVIVTRTFGGAGLGQAIADRLRRAASRLVRP
jgi:L-threonylcarbamoyladenylate synthase